MHDERKEEPLSSNVPNYEGCLILLCSTPLRVWKSDEIGVAKKVMLKAQKNKAEDKHIKYKVARNKLKAMKKLRTEITFVTTLH